MSALKIVIATYVQRRSVVTKLKIPYLLAMYRSIQEEGVERTDTVIRAKLRNGEEEYPDEFPGIPMVMMIKINAVRRKQRLDGYFDCFGRATAGYCDQVGCTYYKLCMEISPLLAKMKASILP